MIENQAFWLRGTTERIPESRASSPRRSNLVSYQERLRWSWPSQKHMGREYAKCQCECQIGLKMEPGHLDSKQGIKANHANSGELQMSKVKETEGKWVIRRLLMFGDFPWRVNCWAMTLRCRGNGAFFIQKENGRGRNIHRWREKEKHICHTIQGAEVFWEQIYHLSIKYEAAWLCFRCTVVSTMITTPTTASLWAMEKWEGLPQWILMTDLWCNHGEK